MKLKIVIFFLFVSLLSGEAKRKASGVKSKWRLTAIANKLFAHRLFIRMARSIPENQNFFISPYAVSAGLSMTLYGARSTTANELLDTLGYTRLSATGSFDPTRVPKLYQKMLYQVHRRDHGFTLTSVNRLFGSDRKVFVPSFVKGVERYYGAKLKQVDFTHHPEQARQQINSWVEDVTNGTIRDAMPPNSVTADTSLVLMSTVYFKGLWEHPFDTTLRSTFHTIDGGRYETDFMQGAFMASYVNARLFQADILSLPFRSSSHNYKMTMELILPHQRGSDHLSFIEDQFDEDNLEYAMEGKRNMQVMVRLPKFTLEFEEDLRETLYDMGIQSLFTRGSANLSGMSPNGGLSLGSAHHKTFIQVDENGTTAGASFGQTNTRAVADIELNFNHPFLLILREQHTKMPIFMGRIAQPRN